MEVRSYYASTVEAAMAMARRELGPEALLVQSQRTAPEWMHLGKYEAVFAGEAIAPPASAPHTRPRPPDPELQALAPPVNPTSTTADAAGRPDFRALFQAAGRSTSAAQSRAVPAAVHPPVPCDPGLGREGFALTVALVGPSGAGKTTMAMKLALRYGVLTSRTVRLLAFDPYCIGSTKQIRHFADLFGISSFECDSLAELQHALADSVADITLIDTPGFSSKQADEKQQLAACLSCFPEVEVQLVLRLDRKPADNLEAVKRFSDFKNRRVILTGLDETSDFSDLPALIARAKTPASFLGTGQQLVEDLEPATPQLLSEIVLKGWAKAARAAA